MLAVVLGNLVLLLFEQNFTRQQFKLQQLILSRHLSINTRSVNILKPLAFELFMIKIILADFRHFVNIAYDELCFRVRGKELNCKLCNYILYIFSILSFW